MDHNGRPVTNKGRTESVFFNVVLVDPLGWWEMECSKRKPKKWMLHLKKNI